MPSWVRAHDGSFFAHRARQTQSQPGPIVTKSARKTLSRLGLEKLFGVGLAPSGLPMEPPCGTRGIAKATKDSPGGVNLPEVLSETHPAHGNVAVSTAWVTPPWE